MGTNYYNYYNYYIIIIIITIITIITSLFFAHCQVCSPHMMAQINQMWWNYYDGEHT